MDAEPKNYLKEWRIFRRLTQEELAERVDTTKAVISNLETGSRGLSAKWLNRLAPALDTRPGFLLDINPLDGDAEMLDAVLAVPAEDRPQALQILQTFKKAG